MTALPFDIMSDDRNSTPDGRLFDTCVEVARNGTPTVFRLDVDELVSVPHAIGDGSRIELVSKRLSFSIDIPVRTNDLLIFSDTILENPEDGASAYTDVRSFWIDNDRVYERGASLERRSEASTEYGLSDEPQWTNGIDRYRDPLHYLRKLAVNWAEHALRSALGNGTPLNRAFDGITDMVIERMGCAVFQVADNKIALAKPAMRLPHVEVSPSALWGESVHFDLSFSSEPIGDFEWKRHLLSFSFAEMEKAIELRDVIVTHFCPAHDDDYNYVWSDASVRLLSDYGRTLTDVERALTMGKDGEPSLSKGLFALGRAMASEKLMTSADLSSVLSLFEEGDIPAVHSLLSEVATQDPEAFDHFLTKKGWDFSFSPLVLSASRLGLELNQLKPTGMRL